MITRIKAWEQSYTAQEQQFSAEEQTHAAAARAVEEALEMLQNYYAQRPLDILDFDTESPRPYWPVGFRGTSVTFTLHLQNVVFALFRHCFENKYFLQHKIISTRSSFAEQYYFDKCFCRCPREVAATA